MEEEFKERFSVYIKNDFVKRNFIKTEKEHPLGFIPQDVCNKALEEEIKKWLGDRGVIRDEIVEVKGKINKLEQDIIDTNNILSDLTLMKEKLENNLINLEDQLEKTEERIEEGDVVMNLIKAVETVKAQYVLGKTPNQELLNRLSQETRIKPEIIRTLGKSYNRGKITREELEEIEEWRVKYLMEHSPQHAPAFEFQLTGSNIVNFLTGKFNPNAVTH